jgi:hypothetical protein
MALVGVHGVCAGGLIEFTCGSIISIALNKLVPRFILWSCTSMSTASHGGGHIEARSFTGPRPIGESDCMPYCPHMGDEWTGEKAICASSVTDFVGVGGMVE